MSEGEEKPVGWDGMGWMGLNLGSLAFSVGGREGRKELRGGSDVVAVGAREEGGSIYEYI